VTARLRRAAARRGDEGFSLTELLVTMLLIGILMTFVLTTTTRLYGSAVDNDVRTTSLNNAQVGMEGLARQIRQAVPNVVAGVQTRYAEAAPARLVVFAATADSAESATGPRRVTFSVENGQLVQETVAPDGAPTAGAYAYTKNPAVRRVLMGGLTNPAALFRYVLDDGTTVATVDAAATRGRIAGVEVTLEVKSNPNRGVAPAVLRNTVYPFNRSER
jgi:prepilin-type N-terminal cleavage/methylation domain-containing protein